jgi:3(or 17)beta-hydroxysteroid dehydrogenase
MARLAGKVALVTGAAKGLGAAIAAAFVREGAHVILCDVDEATGAALAERLGPAAAFVTLDVRREAEWITVLEAADRRWGRLDILVNNAGVVRLGTIEDTSEEDYRAVMAVSADGTFFGCKHAVPWIARSGGGAIVNLSSINAIRGNPPVTAYCAAKGAVAALTRAVAAHCKERGNGVRCNAILPSSIDTPMVRSVRERTGASPSARLGVPDDVAHLALYLASDESAFMNGQCLALDDAASVMR